MTSNFLVYDEKTDGFKISNIVFKISFDINVDSIDLNSLSEHLEGSGFRTNFPALVWRTGDSIEVGTMLLFNSGKIVLTGAKEMADVDKGMEYIKSVFKDHEIIGRNDGSKDRVIASNFMYEVTNIVSTGEYSFSIDLNEYVLQANGARYEPEIFPGLIHKIYVNGGTKLSVMLLFTNGRYVCTGAKTKENIKKSVKYVEEFINGNNLSFAEGKSGSVF